MSTKIVGGVEYHDSYLIASRNISFIEGNLLTTIELLGLPREQSEALKSQIRQIVWGRGVMKYGIHMDSEEVAEWRHDPNAPDQSLKEK